MLLSFIYYVYQEVKFCAETQFYKPIIIFFQFYLTFQIEIKAELGCDNFYKWTVFAVVKRMTKSPLLSCWRNPDFCTALYEIKGWT